MFTNTQKIEGGKMESIKQIKKSVKALSKQKFKVVDLSVENGREEYEFLSDDLKEILINKLDAQKIDYDGQNINIFFSLSYSQGDGFMFNGLIDTQKARFKIKHSGHYYHYNSKQIDLICLFKGKDKIECYCDEFSDADQKKADAEKEVFNEWYVDLCKDMEKVGYGCIEAQEEQNIIRQGFEDWKIENDIVSDLEIYDIDYKIVKVGYMGKDAEKPKGYVKICNDGDTNIRLFIKDFDIETKEYVKVIADIQEYKEHEIRVI